ncbi:hypothetical protein NMY22_g11673 [Coprinellus aureogranulatus]|nr:hypothetical protein NMY22_g11673 [Coprinellus aureogranulatus]
MANEELRALAGPYPNGLTSGLPPTPGSRGSMILYRRADSFTSPPSAGVFAPEELTGNQGQGQGRDSYFLPPPPIGSNGGGGKGGDRGSVYSQSGDSIVSMGMGDSKYPPSLFAPGTPGTPIHPGLPHNNSTGQIRTTGVGPRGPFQGLGVDGHLSGYTSGVGGYGGGGLGGGGYAGGVPRGSVFSDNRTSVAFSLNGLGSGGGLVAYAYDPDEDDLSEDDEDDWLHDPEVAYPKVCSSVLVCLSLWFFPVLSFLPRSLFLLSSSYPLVPCSLLPSPLSLLCLLPSYVDLLSTPFLYPCNTSNGLLTPSRTQVSNGLFGSSSPRRPPPPPPKGATGVSHSNSVSSAGGHSSTLGLKGKSTPSSTPAPGELGQGRGSGEGGIGGREGGEGERGRKMKGA